MVKKRAKTRVCIQEMIIIEFNLTKRNKNRNYEDVVNETIEIIKSNMDENDYFLLKNKAYSFGDTETQPLIMVHKNDYNGFSGTLELFIRDIIYDLIP